MKKIIMVGTACLALLFCSGAALAGQAVNGVGGFILGENIEKYKNNTKMDSSMPIRYLESVREVEIKNAPDFRSGLIAYGSCAEKGKILRVKLKYADSSRKFFELLMKKYKERYGEPTEWKGDSFGVVITWKWSLTNDQGEKVSLIIQHNLLDVEEKVGNVVKLTLSDRLDKEIECFNKIESEPREVQQPQVDQDRLDWSRLLPN
ncbi:MAG: hypothetical protein V1816_27820 [Pseudomonadota bacterium]